MKLYNVVIKRWLKEYNEYLEFQKQYIGKNETDVIKSAKKKNPGDTVLSATEIGNTSQITLKRFLVQGKMKTSDLKKIIKP